MATVQHPQHPQPDAYRLPNPGAFQRPPEMYGPPPPVAAPVVPPVVYPTAAPRQRTAIACRYCRRRKIRCSGFDTSQDGRCSNCVRFNQDCMFTPVSSQTQAFVPAHAAYPHLRNMPNGPRIGGRGEPVILYGAHGQPLPPPHLGHAPDSTLPMPPVMYPHPYGRSGPIPVTLPSGQPIPLAHPVLLHDPVSRKRPHPDEAALSPSPGHSPSVSSFNSSRSSPQRAPQGRRESVIGYDYSGAPTLPPVPAATSGAGYSPHPAAVGQGPFYSPSQSESRRLSSHSSYSFDQSNPPANATLPAPNLPYPSIQQPPPPPQSPSSGRDSDRTPPPGQASNGRRSGLSVTDMLVPAEPQSFRSDADSRMVSALDRQGLNR
ncbi:hypothetical protein LOZ55_001676 [Ophidiomyces ophidiicola]|nr:hypothetical protein LOZ55_001676 [Ophidiomyces ophidiicola]